MIAQAVAKKTDNRILTLVDGKNLMLSPLEKLGKCKKLVYLCKDGKNVELSESEHGHFFTDEVYIVDMVGDNHRYIVQWVGPRLNRDKMQALREQMAKLTNYIYSPNQITRLSVE